MTYLEDLNLIVKQKLAKAAIKEMQHMKYLTAPYYKKSRKYSRYLKITHCLDCTVNANLKLKL